MTFFEASWLSPFSPAVGIISSFAYGSQLKFMFTLFLSYFLQNFWRLASMVVHTSKPRLEEGSQVLGQPGLHSKTLLEREREREKERDSWRLAYLLCRN
jgi:hypothetical protein